MIILIFGPPGSGKGTQAKFFSEELNIPHISVGDLFRSLKGEIKEKVSLILKNGSLVSDELTLEIVKERIFREDCKNGFILDGFPRNFSQAKELEELVSVDWVLEISLSSEESVKRILGRRICPGCNRGFNVFLSPRPKVEGICDFCKSKLVARADDTEETILKRIDIYHKETEPVLDLFKEKVLRIDGTGTIEEIEKRIGKIIKNKS